MGSEKTNCSPVGYLPVSVVSEAARDDIGECLSGVRHEREATVVTTLRFKFLIAQGLDRRILLPIHTATMILVELCQSVRIYFVGQDLRETNRKGVKPNHLAVRHRTARFFRLEPRRGVGQRPTRGGHSMRASIHGNRITGRRLTVVFKQSMKPPCPASG